MTAAALRFLGGRQFLLVVEEEGTDNFGNCNNAVGLAEALRRGDEGLGTALGYIEKHPDTLLVTFGDSEAGNADVIGLRGSKWEVEMLAKSRDPNGAPLDGAVRGSDGSIEKPFTSQPDRSGKTHDFVVDWGTRMDSCGGILVRAAGMNSDKVPAPDLSEVPCEWDYDCEVCCAPMRIVFTGDEDGVVAEARGLGE
jgi:alkaline phosphatase